MFGGAAFVVVVAAFVVVAVAFVVVAVDFVVVAAVLSFDVVVVSQRIY